MISTYMTRWFGCQGKWRGRMFATAALLCLGMFAQDAAETVSIWKMECDPYSGKRDVRSLQNQAYDFATAGTFAAADVPIAGTPAVLPDNPGWLDDPVNRSALKVSSGMLKNAAIIPYLELTNSWTVEGWYCLRELPNDGAWKYVIGTRNSDDGWLLSSRNHSGVYQFELYSSGNPRTAIADGTVVWGFNPDDVTNTWKHLALSYDANGTETPGKGVWKFYVDGEITVTLTNAAAVTGKINKSNFYIGGRDNGSLRTNFSMDYWRVTCGVLTPEQFLNASGVKSETTVPGTLAFYRLDQDGGFENAVGNAYRLSADYPYGSSYSQAYNYISNFKIAPSARQAFDTLPNPSVPLENSGSVRLFGRNGRLSMEGNLGAQLEPDKPFTIEGWVYREPALYSARPWSMMFGTRERGTGFALWYGMNVDANRNAFGMYCDTTGGVMRSDVRFPKATNVPFENEWKHIALTQTPNGFEDKTVWELFLDGESMGCVTGMIASANMTGRNAFYIGSRPDDSLGAGCYDCFRVCSRVLAPSEFLNAANGTAVASADILAFWPLDSINNGLYLDLHDRAGNYPIGKFSDFTGRVTLSSEQAADSVPNPDSAVRTGDPKKDNGSVSFPDASKPNYLYVGDGIGKSFLSLTNDFTVESWICHKKLPSGWSIVYGAGYNAPRWGLWIRKDNNVVKYMMIAQRSGAVYLVNDNTFFSKDGAYATITDADLNVWRHVALVYRADVGNGTFELFLDGVSKGTIELLSAPPAGGTGIAGDLFVGGRPSDTGHSLIGNVDLLRISAVALTPDRFLCATAQGTPAAAKTCAYWPLDYDGASADLSDRVSGMFRFTYSGTAPVGTNHQFRARVGNPDKTPGFIGDPAVNVGSVLNTPGCVMSSSGLRGSVTVFSSFAAEGWINWSGNGALPQAITGNQLESARGWTLSLQNAHTLRLEAHDAHGGLLVDKTFDTGADSLNGCWRHVAVAYSLASGNRGRWQVFLDGRSLGSVDNEVVPEVMDGFKGSYGIGAQTGYTPFDGLLDCWRVSDGVLDPDDFLYVSPQGMTILLR